MNPKYRILSKKLLRKCRWEVQLIGYITILTYIQSSATVGCCELKIPNLELFRWKLSKIIKIPIMGLKDMITSIVTMYVEGIKNRLGSKF